MTRKLNGTATGRIKPRRSAATPQNRPTAGVGRGREKPAQSDGVDQDGTDNAPAADGEPAQEIDVGSVVRPERFITPAVSGLTVPILRRQNGEISSGWLLYLGWRTGKRECIDLPESLTVGRAGMLWIDPQPPALTKKQSLGWSLKGREDWLAGRKTPGPSTVFRRIRKQFDYYVELPGKRGTATLDVLGLFAMFTYCVPAWDAVPYLHLTGTKGSGKSLVLQLLLRTTFRPLHSSSLTGPVLFRTLHLQGGSLLLDEAERLRQPEQNELLAMLLAGYKRGGQAMRLISAGEREWHSTAFDVYGPKALASIASLPAALGSRCIPILMLPAAASSPKLRRRLDEPPMPWQALCDDLHALALGNGPILLDLARRPGVCPRMTGRQYELWQPLLALAWWIERDGERGLLKRVQQHALDTIAAHQDEQAPEADEILLRLLALWGTTHASKRRLPSSPGRLLAAAKGKDSATFRQWTAKGVAVALRRYGIETHKVQGVRCYNHVKAGDVRLVAERHGIDLELPDTTHPPFRQRAPRAP